LSKPPERYWFWNSFLQIWQEHSFKHLCH
jgi:hypothetical protein